MPVHAHESQSVRALIERSPHVNPMLVTVDEAAVTLRLAPTTIKRLIRRGEIRCVLVGGQRRIRRIPATELSRYVADLVRQQITSVTAD